MSDPCLEIKQKYDDLMRLRKIFIEENEKPKKERNPEEPMSELMDKINEAIIEKKLILYLQFVL